MQIVICMAKPRQLHYYAKAAERIFGRAADEVYIYCLSLGEAVDMKKIIK